MSRAACGRCNRYLSDSPIDYTLHWQQHFSQTTKRTISLQKVHLWMEISAGCPNRGRRSLTKMDRLRNVQSSVWTLQQIFVRQPHRLYTPLTAAFLPTTKRTISLQKVHLWMDCGKRILWSWTQSNATKIRAATVQSSVWTLQQIFVRQTILFYMYKKSGYIAFASLHNH